MESTCPTEQFPALSAVPGLVHSFTLRVPGLDVAADKPEAMRRLEPFFHTAIQSIGAGEFLFAQGEQIHGNAVFAVDSWDQTGIQPGIDGLVTGLESVLLGIYVADCCALYLVDPVRRALGLVHSGKKGTELEITTQAIQRMTACYGSDPKDLTLQLSPCIRPPAYEVDFAATIRQQALDAGVPAQQIHDSGVCTAAEPERYYSYRREQGKTGRMLALLGWSPQG